LSAVPRLERDEMDPDFPTGGWIWSEGCFVVMGETTVVVGNCCSNNLESLG